MDRMTEVYGFNADPETMEGDFLAYTVDHLFGDVWNRPELDVASRRLLVIGALVGQGHTDVLEVQFGAALANGELTPAQLREIVVLMAHYAGWPVAAKVNTVVEQIIARRNQPGA